MDTRSTLAGDNHRTRAAECQGTGGAELSFVLGKTKDHAIYIWESVQAKPHRIRRAGIHLLLGIGDCGERGREGQHESNGAQFVHDVALQFKYRSNNDWNRNLFHSAETQLLHQFHRHSKVPVSGQFCFNKKKSGAASDRPGK